MNPGTYLTGGGSTGNVTLDIDTNKVPTLSSNSFTGAQYIHNGSLLLDNTGKIGVGFASPDRRLQIAETSTATARGVTFDQYSSDQFASLFALRKSRNVSPGFHTILQNGDALFNFTGQGSDGTKFVDIARIRMEIDGVPGVSNMPGRMTFWTTPNGAASTAERMRIDSAGNVGIGTTSPTEKLHVVGNIRATGSIFTQPSPETEIPDYVFEPGYMLLPFEELMSFVEKEKHLPNLPNAAEIKAKGLNLSDFQMKLLETIEERTLYTAQQAKVIRELEAAKKSETAALEAKDVRIAALEGKNRSIEAKNIELGARIAGIEQVLQQLADRKGNK